MENQKKVVPLGRLSNVIVDIYELHTTTDFEVIEIVDDINSYPKFLLLDWVFDNMPIIISKKRKMIFERNNRSVIVQLDPSEGAHYIEPVKEEYDMDVVDNIYQITIKEE